jgi:hypothetical protein
MKKQRKSLQEFNIMANVRGTFSVTIRAASFEDAVQRAGELDVDDFVTAVEQFDDSRPLEIISIYRNDSDL